MEETEKGQWTSEEDNKLVSYIQQHGSGDWTAVSKNTGIYVLFLYTVLLIYLSFWGVCIWLYILINFVIYQDCIGMVRAAD